MNNENDQREGRPLSDIINENTLRILAGKDAVRQVIASGGGSIITDGSQ